MIGKIRVGFALTGSFCTFSKVLPVMEQMAANGYEITPIMSEHASHMDTRFGAAESFCQRIESICGKAILTSITDAEPIGPEKRFDVLVIAPCTGNTIAKLTYAITDTAVTMAAKSHLRNDRPVILAVSTNDALSGSAKNIGELLNRKNYYFVPMAQDNPDKKPRSVVAQMNRIPETIEMACSGKQIQPIFCGPSC